MVTVRVTMVTVSVTMVTVSVTMVTVSVTLVTVSVTMVIVSVTTVTKCNRVLIYLNSKCYQGNKSSQNIQSSIYRAA